MDGPDGGHGCRKTRLTEPIRAGDFVKTLDSRRDGVGAEARPRAGQSSEKPQVAGQRDLLARRRVAPVPEP